jgi:hypothetical protein
MQAYDNPDTHEPSTPSPPRRAPPLGGYLLIGFAILILAVGWLSSLTASSSFGDVHQDDQHFLQTLAAGQVTAVQIGRQCALSSDRRGAFVDAVHRLSDFQVNHDLGAYVGVLTITLTGGEQHKFRLYEHPRGIVIEFYRGDDDDAYAQKGSIGYNVYGYVISAQLPGALNGITPRCV